MDDNDDSSILPNVKLGRTGLSVSRLGLGGFHQVEVSSEIVAATIDAFLAVGGNYIETARDYGKGASEIKIGDAIAGRRKKVVLASKSSSRTADGVRQDLETSLKALATDHIEIYFFHNVMKSSELRQIDSQTGALTGLLRAREEGLIGGIGFTSHDPKLYMQAMMRLPISVILIWNNYLDHQYLPEIQEEVLPMARSAGVGVTMMKPLADGFLHRSVEKAMRYCLGAANDVVVCGMNSPAHVGQAAVAVGQGPLKRSEKEKLLRNAPELGRYVCRQCGDCSDDLMHLFRMEGLLDRQMIDYLPHDPADYALRLRLAGWFGLAARARSEFAAAGFNEETLLADAAKVRCPFSIDVARKTQIALAKLKKDRPELL